MNTKTLIDKKIPLEVADNLIKKFVLKYLVLKSKKFRRIKTVSIVFANEWIGANIFVDKIYEKKSIQDIYDIFKTIRKEPKNGHMLDVGANIGNHTIQFSKNFKSVMAFEPHKKVFDVLKLNTKDISNIKNINKAVGNKIGKVKLKDNKENYGASKIIKSKKKIKHTEAEISKLSVLVKKLSPIFYIKIDTEGSELQVLKGGKKIIEKFKPVISLEQKINDFKSKNKETDSIIFLRKMGYKFFVSKEDFGFKNFILKKIKIFFGIFMNFSINRKIIELKNIKKRNYNFLIAIHNCDLNKEKFIIN